MKKDKTLVVKKGKVVTKKKTYKIPKKIRKKFMEGLIRYTNITNLQNGDYQKKSNALLSKDPLTVDVAFKYVDNNTDDSNGNTFPMVMIYPNCGFGEALSYEKETDDSQVNYATMIESEFKRIENHYCEFSKMPIGSIFVFMGFIMVKTGGSSKAAVVDIVSNDVIDELTNDERSEYLDMIRAYNNNSKLIPDDIMIAKGDTVSVMRNKLNYQAKYIKNDVAADSDNQCLKCITMMLIGLNFYINGLNADDALYKYDKSGGLILFKDLYMLDINELLLGKTDVYHVSPSIFEIACNAVECYEEAKISRNNGEEPEVEFYDDDDDETDSD